MLENIYVCRHGHRQNWVDPTVEWVWWMHADSSTGPSELYHDPPLSAHGLEQAERLGEHIASHALWPQPDALFSSPFDRTLHTIAPLSRLTGLPIHVDHGVQEWFSPSLPENGLHTRPPGPEGLQPIFPHITLEQTYTSTYFPIRSGESIPQFRERMEVFLPAWISRVEAEMPHVKTAVLMSHAATVIGLGRALIGDYTHDVNSPVANVSLYRRKNLPGLPGLEPLPLKGTPDAYGQGKVGGELGQWVQLVNGDVSFLPNGAERAWTWRDCQLQDNGEVIMDPGNGLPFTEADLHPVGLAPGMDKYASTSKAKF